MHGRFARIVASRRVASLPLRPRGLDCDWPNDAAGRCHCNSGPSGSRWSISFPSPHSPARVVHTDRAGEWRADSATRATRQNHPCRCDREEKAIKRSRQTDRQTAVGAASNRKREWQRGRWDPSVWAQAIAVNRRAAPPITPPGRARSCTCVSAPRFMARRAIAWPSPLEVSSCCCKQRIRTKVRRQTHRRHSARHCLPLSFPR